MTSTKHSVLQHAAQADVLDVLGGTIAVRLRGEQTAHRLAMVENLLPAGFGNLPLHVHPDFDEAFYLLEGELSFRVGDEVVDATPGTLVYVPGDVPHTFAELTGKSPARFLLWITPAGHETYFEALAEAAQRSPTGYPAPEELGALMAEHAIEIVGSPDPRA